VGTSAGNDAGTRPPEVNMRQTIEVDRDGPPRARPGWRRRWPEWAPLAAGSWSLLYGLLGLWWTLGGDGFPFGEGDPDAVGSLLAGVPTSVGAPVVAALGLAGAAAALAMVRPWGRRLPRRLLATFAWAMAATLLLVVPDARVLMLLGYLPALVFRFGFENLDWPVLNQLLAIAGGALWAAAALAYQRRSRHACLHCGRTDHAAGGPRWGRWVTWVAVAAPLPYAATRLAWALGVPLGVPDEFMALYQADYVAKGVGLWRFTLGGMALGGSILTMGLIQRWGEVFPHWIPLLAGRRVPPPLAIVPATLVALAVTVASVTIWSGAAAGGIDLGLTGDSWGLGGPMLVWPVWGISLGAATLAYHLRRRGRCRSCGRW
jgi:hypothetical protein